MNQLMNESINEWINDEAVYRTAPATPGLLKKGSPVGGLVGKLGGKIFSIKPDWQKPENLAYKWKIYQYFNKKKHFKRENIM